MIQKTRFVRVGKNKYVNPERVCAVFSWNGGVLIDFGTDTDHASIRLENEDIDDVIAYLNGKKEWKE